MTIEWFQAFRTEGDESTAVFNRTKLFSVDIQATDDCDETKSRFRKQVAGLPKKYKKVLSL